MKKNGVLIYLSGTPEHLHERTRHDRNRPLLQTENPLAKLRELYQQRDPLYREVADIVVDTGRQGVGGMIRVLQSKIELLQKSLMESPS
jgi:shikimate kinase